jgi:ribosomal protein S18 acetylase RimI-like enzyme
MSHENVVTSWRVVKADSSHWRLFKQVRLRALLEDPHSFSSKYEDEEKISDDNWIERLTNQGQVHGTWLGLPELSSETHPVIGLARLAETDAPSDGVDLVSVWIDPQYRGRGLARALINAAIDHAKRCNHAFVSLTVTTTNVAAIRLYESMGFAITDENLLHPVYSSLFEHRMVLPLSV